MAKETDLFEPIKTYFEAQGYDIYQEVKGIDVVGINRVSGDVVLIELKLHFNIKLMTQALKNKRFNPEAKSYIVFPKKGGHIGFTSSDMEKVDLLNLTEKEIGILTVDLDSKTVTSIRSGGRKRNVYSIFNSACTDLHKEKTAGAKSGETLTERQIIIDRVYKILTVLPYNKCSLDDLINVFVPVILKHYSSKSSFVSVMRNTASYLFEIRSNNIYLKEEES